MEELSSLNIDNKTKNDITNIVEELRQYPYVHAVILFGSYAKGRIKPISDIDICVITDKDITFEQKVAIVGLASDKLDISIFGELPLPIQFRVFREGKILFNRDWLTLHRIRIETVREYLDFLPIIERYINREFPKNHHDPIRQSKDH
ncbi:TPA: nucleotidyltransferase domain-containing protein [Candidatus Poribacteria bacterium]|nr:nucleotidyltransferase domain-containing protein [Candidatus Poribacteria bacterium]